MKQYFLVFLLIQTLALWSQEDSARMAWFGDAKLGIFIHWGMYSVDGTTESWAFHNKEVTFDAYMDQKNRFDASKYNPELWADLIEASGAKYVVMTFQHHDGLALWDTKQLTPAFSKKLWLETYPNRKYPAGKTALWNSNLPLSTVYQTPAHRDLIAPFEQAIRSRNLKFGAYYSLMDWVHPDYPNFINDKTKYEFSPNRPEWQRYLNFMHAQLSEINSRFKPDLYWFDGDWEHTESEWNAPKIDSIIHTTNSKAIFNGRLLTYSDYDTPEQNMPIVRPLKKYWELCMTMNSNWGYRPSDSVYKTPYEVLTIFTECLNLGGNLLMDIGPKADGTIPIEQVELLQGVGRWTKKHAEAIYGTHAGLPYGHYAGNSTISADSTVIYLFVNTPKTNNEPTSALTIHLKGVYNAVEQVTVVGNDEALKVKLVGKISWSSVPGTLFVEIPATKFDSDITVLKVKLNKRLQLYRGRGGFN